MLKKLRTKFICITMVIVTVMLGVVFALVYHFTRLNLERDSLEMMSQVTEKGPPGSKDNSVKRPYFILSVSEDGTVSVRESGNFDLSDKAFTTELTGAALSTGRETGYLREYGFRFLRVNPDRGDHDKKLKDDHPKNPLDQHIDDLPEDHKGPPEEFSDGQLLVFADTSGEIAVLRNMIFNSLLIGTMILVAFFVVSLFLARWAIKPVERAWTQQKQFIADASHELKTPLTVILTNAELLQDSTQKEEGQKQCAKSILTMSNQMRGLVDGLLKLAQVSEGAEETPLVKLDFSTLVSDSLLPFDPVFFEQGLLLESNICPNLTVKGSESHLQQLVEILLDNAQKYSLPHSTVRVELTKAGCHCYLKVINSGDEIRREDLKNIFKRFYRVDKARSMTHSYGLGLSIAQQITENHNGKIWAESARGENTFTVQLPLQ